MNLQIYPTKSLFKNDESISFHLLSNNINFDVEIIVFDLTEEVFRKTFRILKNESIVNLPSFPKNKSYGVTCTYEGLKVRTAFETYDTWKMVPRYGFLSDFETSNLHNTDFIKMLLKLHINVVQYYDWMFQHNDLISPVSEFTDLMGRKLNQDVVKERVELCSSKNITNMAYGAIYGASNKFFESHKEWAFYNHKNDPIQFIDVFTIMNFTKDSKWRDHLLNEYKKAVEIIGFDGIHMDTYGYPKTAKDFKGNVIHLEEHFKDLINDTKKHLVNNNLSSDLIFNNVGSWPIDKTYDAEQSALYIEIWDPISNYEDISTLVRKVHALTKEKELIISAYLKPYYEKDSAKAVYSHKYLYALLSSLGAHHLIMGEDQKVLRTGYYCDYGVLNNNHFNEIKKYYDYNCEFSQILYGEAFTDVSVTHTFGDNIEYVLDKRCSVHANKGSIYTIIRESKNIKVINLINFINIENTRWNEGHNTPAITKDINIEILAIRDIIKIVATSPDFDSETIDFTITPTNRGNIISFIVPTLEYWTSVIIIEAGDNDE